MPTMLPPPGSVETPNGFDAFVQASMLVDPNGNAVSFGGANAGAGDNAPAKATVIAGIDSTGKTRLVRVSPEGFVVIEPVAVARTATPAAVAVDGAPVDQWFGSRGQAKVELVASAGTAFSVSSTSLADGGANPGGGVLNTASFGLVFNGTTWDRLRGSTAGLFIQNQNSWTESATALAASATITGLTRATGGTQGGTGSRHNYFGAFISATATGGTMFIEASVDGTNWFVAATQAVAIGPNYLRAPVTAPNYRARYVNGANAQTATLFTSGFATA